MALGMNAALNALRQAEKIAEAELGKIRAAIGSLTGGSVRRGRPAGSKNKPRKKKRKPMSAATKKKMAAAKKKWWAAKRAAEKK